MKLRKTAWTLVAGLVFGLVSGCAEKDPRRAILEARAEWQIEVTSWIPADDGTIVTGIKISGPARSTLEQLTFLIRLLDAQGQVVREEWRTVDLSQVPQGAPVEKQFRIDSGGVEIEGLSVDPVLLPDPEQEARIPELQL